MRRALIVDDKVENIEFLKTLLERTGWTVDVARQGAEALDLARLRMPDVVISDLLMPVMDGYTLLRHWKADAALCDIPFIIYTATYTAAEDERLARDLGADAFILKPLEPADFLLKISAALARSGSTIPIPRIPMTDDPTQLKLYSEALIGKLEEKSLQLERSNQQLLQDIAARTRAEQALRDREARLQMFLDLTDALRAGGDRRAALQEAMRILATYLAAPRCVLLQMHQVREDCVILAAYDERGGMGAPGSRIPMTKFGHALRKGFLAGSDAVVVRDVDGELGALEREAVASFEASAFLCVPAVRTDAVYVIVVATHAGPRAWTPIDVAVMREILERCLAAIERDAIELTLRRNESLLRIAGKAALLGGWTVDVPSLERLEWTDEVYAIHEVPPGTPLSTADAINYYAPEFRDLITSKVRACAIEGTPFDVEAQLITATQRRIWVRSMGFPERGPTGAIIGVQGALQDIDERHKLQEQYRQAQKMEAVGRLAGGVAHDFNNLLSVILSYTDFLLADLRPADPIRNEIEEIHNAGKRATSLTRQLLAFSRQQVLQPQVLDLAAVVRNMERLLRRLLGEEIKLVLAVGGASGRVFADASQLEQILMNLAVNARDAMPSGGSLTIELADAELDAEYAPGVPPGAYVRLAVTDTGTGMDATTRERIFEPFFTTKDKGKGTGLGLSTVFGIVNQSQGHISVRSDVGRGTSFEVYLPRTERSSETTVAAPEPTTSLRGTETILVAEDDDQVRTMTRAMLRRQGYKVLDAANGGEALLICEQTGDPIHLLLTDVVMPRLSGRELAERLARIRPDMKVIFVSGYNEDAILQHGVSEAAMPFLQKPYAPDALLRKVREVLDAKPRP